MSFYSSYRCVPDQANHMVLTRSQRVRLESEGSEHLTECITEKNSAVLTPKPLNRGLASANPDMKGSAQRGVLSHPLGGEKPSHRESSATKEEQENHNCICKLPDGGEPKVVEVTYPSVFELASIAEGSVDDFVSDVEAQLKSTEWISVCSGMNGLRSLAVHNPDRCDSVVSSLLPFVVKGIRSPRSALSKSAIIASKDLFQYIPSSMAELIGDGSASTSLLSQLLLKAASNDKRFVVDEAVASLEQMAQSLASLKVMSALMPYAEHKNPKVRGRVMKLLLMVLEGKQCSAATIVEVGLDRIIIHLAQGVNDNTAEARESSRKITERLLAMMREEEALGAIVGKDEETDETSSITAYFSKVLGTSKAAIFLKSFDY